MRRAIAIIGLALAATVLQGGAAPATATCRWCYEGECYNNSICGAKCFCLKRGGEVSGACFSAGAIPEGYEPFE